MTIVLGIVVFGAGWIFGLVTGWALAQADKENTRRCNQVGGGKHVPAREKNCWDPRKRD